MKCDVCGIESELDAAFIKQRRCIGSDPKVICPNCWVKRNNSKHLGFLVVIAVGGVCGLSLHWVAPDNSAGQFLVNLFLIWVFVILSILPHELGHAFTGRALGWHVHQIVVGIGKPLFKARWAGMLFDFRSIPVAAATWVLPEDTRWLRPKWFLIIFAGPLVNAAMALAVIVACGGNLRPLDLDSMPIPARLFVWANAWVLLINLCPHQAKASFGLLTDGGQLMQLLSFRKKAIARLQALRYTFEASASRDRTDLAAARSWCEKGLALFPEDVHLLNLSAITYLDEQNYQPAREVLLKLLAKEDQPPYRRAVYLNNLAYADALSQNPAWLAEADVYSKDAYTMLPWAPEVVGTRGTVLVALGRYEEGLSLLQKSMEDAYTPRSKADNACYIAIALARRGKLGEALKYLRVARDLHGKSPILARAEEVLQSSQSPEPLGIGTGCPGQVP
jgi:tetratricopeptide (TPR) repeat protein